MRDTLFNPQRFYDRRAANRLVQQRIAYDDHQARTSRDQHEQLRDERNLNQQGILPGMRPGPTETEEIAQGRAQYYGLHDAWTLHDDIVSGIDGSVDYQGYQEDRAYAEADAAYEDPESYMTRPSNVNTDQFREMAVNLVSMNVDPDVYSPADMMDDKLNEAEDLGLVRSMMISGYDMSKPVVRSTSTRGMSDQKWVQGNGHHRIAAANFVDGDMQVPVLYSNSTFGYKTRPH